MRDVTAAIKEVCLAAPVCIMFYKILHKSFSLCTTIVKRPPSMYFDFSLGKLLICWQP